MTRQFDKIKKKLALEYKNGGIDNLNKFVNVAITKLTYIFILLKDPSNATTVFHGLNDPGEPIGIGDLVRNEVFSYVYESPDLAQTIYNDEWEPFHRKLGEYYDKYFFPYAVIHDPSIKTSDLFKGLREIWDDDVRGPITGPHDIIRNLDVYTQPYLAIAANKIPESYDKEVAHIVRKFSASNSPTSIYPMVTKLLYEYENGKVDVTNVVGILKVIEAFLVRRALCGIEPTGLLSIFRFMWNNLKGDITAEKVKEVISNRTTLDWPTDERFKSSIVNRAIYGSSIAKYALLEYDRSLGGDFPEDQDPWVEHVLPQSFTPEWQAVISEDDHRKYLHTWGNLIPLSSEMNRELSKSIYSIKKDVIKTDSMYQSARKLANDYGVWDKNTIIERSNTIANWAVTRWPR